MENSLVVLIIIASVIYKIYTNYKKEVEKTKQRNYRKKPNPTPVYIPEPIQQKQNVNSPYADETYVYSNQLETVPDEVKRITELKKQNQSLGTIKVEDENKNSQKRYPFDLRQAILQSAILERPYK